MHASAPELLKQDRETKAHLKAWLIDRGPIRHTEMIRVPSRNPENSPPLPLKERTRLSRDFDVQEREDVTDNERATTA